METVLAESLKEKIWLKKNYDDKKAIKIFEELVTSGNLTTHTARNLQKFDEVKDKREWSSIDFLQNKYKIVEDEFKNISTTLKSPDWKEAPEFKIEGSSSDAQIQRFVELYSSIRMIFYTSLKLIYILFSNIYKEYHDKYGMPIAEYTSVDNLKKYDEAIQRMEIEGELQM